MRFFFGLLLGAALGALAVRQYVLSNKGIQICQQVGDVIEGIRQDTNL